MNTTRNTLASLALSVLALAAVTVGSILLTSSPANAAPLVGELGVLDLGANGGLNPATSSPWQVGDQYRFAFVTSETRDATSTDIADYNAFVQAVADASSLGLGGATWNVIGSTETVNARVNTSTTGPGGESIFLLDGSTVFATDYTDLWNGVGVPPWLNVDEDGDTVGGLQVFTGTQANGVTVADRYFGTTTISNNALRVTVGRTDANNSSRWMQQYNTGPSSLRPFYGLSDPLTVGYMDIAGPVIPEPSTAALLGLAMLCLAACVRRRNS